ncbi:hypothetical protein [Streptomyces venezuelae]|uniref:hypothetical protein n=1 Tax=Streptomyces venezuelae TaxID=54571 RepID=UPI00331D640B
MGIVPALPSPARAFAEAAVGLPLTVEEVTDRRGSAVWKATGPTGAVAVKAGYGEAGERATAREVAVLGALGIDYFLGSGYHEGGSWLVTRWLDAPSTKKVFEPVRNDAGGREEALSAAVELCRAVADLHAAGWVHSDLQPAHGVHTPDGVRLLDMSWAWREGFEPPAAFRGGIVHLLAPELAASIGVGIMPVAPSPSAEVHALAGSLWTCVTGRWPLDYQAAGIDPDRLDVVQLRARVASRKVPLDVARPWPEVQDVLQSVLMAPRRERPSAADLSDALARL